METLFAGYLDEIPDLQGLDIDLFVSQTIFDSETGTYYFTTPDGFVITYNLATNEWDSFKPDMKYLSLGLFKDHGVVGIYEDSGILYTQRLRDKAIIGQDSIADEIHGADDVQISVYPPSGETAYFKLTITDVDVDNEGGYVASHKYVFIDPKSHQKIMLDSDIEPQRVVNGNIWLVRDGYTLQTPNREYTFETKIVDEANVAYFEREKLFAVRSRDTIRFIGTEDEKSNRTQTFGPGQNVFFSSDAYAISNDQCSIYRPTGELIGTTDSNVSFGSETYDPVGIDVIVRPDFVYVVLRYVIPKAEYESGLRDYLVIRKIHA